jgi:hypothetical protein
MRELYKKLLTVAVVIAAFAVVLIAEPYIRPQPKDMPVEDANWQFPYKEGYVFVVRWSVLLDSIDLACALSVNEVYFDNPNAIEQDESAQSYNTWPTVVSDPIGEDTRFTVSVTCTFVDKSGSMAAVNLGQDGGVIRQYGYDIPGPHADEFVLFTESDAGTYTFTLSVMAESSPGVWNSTVAGAVANKVIP